ncbi:uncharacterized protein PAC_01037 [Phialocephala subalpina]|uniref:Ubiquitin 3 binding protein But2 C-terminal domain-containing protein n=1 Tax=Phialocephala subalpina TaxID=576137 RepID=A0A1L7WEF1_9HELO|nr:uncharacterized protein PAC_01037 [Phialocephala subalpina]
MRFSRIVGSLLSAAAAVLAQEVDGYITIKHDIFVASIPAQWSGALELSHWLEPGEETIVPYSPIGAGTSIKISRDTDLTHGILQFEYTNNVLGPNQGCEIYLNLSDVDGRKSGEPGSPFIDAHINYYPVGVGSETCNMDILECLPWVECEAAFRHAWDNKKVHSCNKRPEGFVIELHQD